MSTIITLFVLGSVMIFFEIFLPGGILGVAGGLAMMAGSVLAFMEYGTGGGIIAIVAGTALSGLQPDHRIQVPAQDKNRPPALSFQGRFRRQSAAYRLGGCRLAGSAGPRQLWHQVVWFSLTENAMRRFLGVGMWIRGTTLIIKGMDNFRLIVSKS